MPDYNDKIEIPIQGIKLPKSALSSQNQDIFVFNPASLPNYEKELSWTDTRDKMQKYLNAVSFPLLVVAVKMAIAGDNKIMGKLLDKIAPSLASMSVRPMNSDEVQTLDDLILMTQQAENVYNDN